MNKLEKLKELIGKSNAAKAAYTDAPDNYISYMASAKADAELSYLLHKLLHPLIEVAEAAIAVSKQTPSKPDYWSSCGQCDSNSQEFEGLLEPLTKDTDE